MGIESERAGAPSQVQRRSRERSVEPPHSERALRSLYPINPSIYLLTAPFSSYTYIYSRVCVHTHTHTYTYVEFLSRRMFARITRRIDPATARERTGMSSRTCTSVCERVRTHTHVYTRAASKIRETDG